MPEVITSINLKQLVQNELNLDNQGAGFKGVKLISTIDYELPDYVIGSKDRVERLLNVLKKNAINYTNKGLVQVKLLEIKRSENKTRIQLTVKSTISGVVRDSIPIIAENHQFQSNHPNSNPMELGEINDLIKDHNGKLSSHCNPGEETELVVELDFIISEAAITPSVARATQAPLFDLSGISILLVEDNEMNQMLATNYLENNNASVTLAENGMVAIEKIKSNQFDLVLMDLQMPIMDGYEATKIIREDLKLNLPIIACSAHSLLGEKKNCIIHGMDDYITKPYEKQAFLEVIHRWATCGGNLDMDDDIESNARLAKNLGLVTFENLNEYSRGNRQFELEIIKLGFKQSTQMLKELEENPDLKAIQFAAHKLKSSFGVLGVDASILDNIEKVPGKSADNRKFEDLVDNLKIQLREVIEQLSIAINKYSI